MCGGADDEDDGDNEGDGDGDDEVDEGEEDAGAVRGGEERCINASIPSHRTCTPRVRLEVGPRGQ